MILTAHLPRRDRPVREPSEAGALSLLGVDYWRLRLPDGGDLYLTCFGRVIWEHLTPPNWYAPDWFAARRVRLCGTSGIYKVPTRPLRGLSFDLVVRFSRVGQELPIDDSILGENPRTEFNSPFEEIALLMELRAGGIDRTRPRILTKKPLAIYIPPERFPDWQIGRVERKIAVKLAQHPEATLDMTRQYLMLYGWIEGLNAPQTVQALGLTGPPAQRFLSEVTREAQRDLERHHFRMLDLKPDHVILRIRSDGSLLCRHGKPAYALVDYELLERLE